MKFVEIRSYNVTPGSRSEFDRLFREQSLPLLKKWKVDVVNWGPSRHDENSYFLIRAYSSLEDRQSSQDAFYSSDDWMNGPREAMLPLIENYVTIVMEMDEETLLGLMRRS